MPPRIVLCYPVEPHHLERIAAAMPGADIIDAGQERIAEELSAADIFCGHAKVPVDWDGVVRRGRLRWIQSSAAGMDHCLVPSVVASDIAVTSASGVLADQVAEHTIALMTAWCRGLPGFFRAQQKREYIRRPTRDLTGATVGIAGLGGVGRRLAELLAPFRVRILATDMFPVDKPASVEALWPAERLDDLLAAVDFLVLCLPLFDGTGDARSTGILPVAKRSTGILPVAKRSTGILPVAKRSTGILPVAKKHGQDARATGTRGIIDAAAIGKMKPGALLVNVARGPLVVTADLIEAVCGGRLAGAVLDVADPEPLPPESALWDLPNVIITPHVGGQSAWRSNRMTELFCQNLHRWRAGLPLVNFITDKRLGFPIRGGGYPLWGQ